MTNDEKAQAIADFANADWWKDHEGKWHFKEDSRMIGGSPLADLNAMREAISRLTLREARWAYLQNLKCIVASNYDWDEFACIWNLLNATAAQQADALLETIGKLKD